MSYWLAERDLLRRICEQNADTNFNNCTVPQEISDAEIDLEIAQEADEVSPNKALSVSIMLMSWQPRL